MLVQLPHYQAIWDSFDVGQIKYIDDLRFGEGDYYYLVSLEEATVVLKFDSLWSAIKDRRELFRSLKELRQNESYI